MTVAEEQRILAHTSIELGHLYMEDFTKGPDRLRDHFARVAPWAKAIRPEGTSTTVLLDDYFGTLSSPAEIVPRLQATAAEAGLRIDYLARESACAQYENVPLARMVAERLRSEPDDSRPPATESGWLCSGRHPVAEQHEAMSTTKTPSTSDGVFVDVELWHDRDGDRKFSCAYLAAIWQLMRLGMIDVVRPQPIGELPRQWEDLPPVIQLGDNAAPFRAERTFSILPSRFLQVEHAVRIILSHLTGQPDPTNRIEYVLFGDT
ncbi:SCO2522 family protein [Actinocrispum sp. NPDC049592]|uniref:SCO2522 family protein n=1 Tax=Actinocrispum sp. NPDC049592 TaxID=3154835 RepID=UPI00343EA94A